MGGRNCAAAEAFLQSAGTYFQRELAEADFPDLAPNLHGEANVGVEYVKLSQKRQEAQLMIPNHDCDQWPKPKWEKRVGAFLLWAAVSALFQLATAPNASAGTILGSNLSTFAILGGAGVTIDGTGSVITGSVGGCCTATAVTGVIPTNFTISGGTVQTGGATAASAQNELGIAITALIGLAPGIAQSSLDNITLGPGVYSVSATNFTGNLTLDGHGNANALWVFLFGSSLTTASSSDVILQNTGSGAGLYWVMGAGSATLGSHSTFEGNILANVAVTVGTDVTVPCGRLLTQTASVTLAGTDTIGIGCSGILAGSNGLSGGEATQGVPEPGTLTLLSMGLGVGVLLLRTFRSIR